MAGLRATSVLFITGILVSCFFSVVILLPRKAVAVQIPGELANVNDLGETVRSHPMTYQEMQKLRDAVGVRDPNRNYNVIVDGHGTGLAPPTEEEWQAMVGDVFMVDSVTSSEPMASSVDLSTSGSFPRVGNQGGQGSCAAWAATYYTYGYLEAADNGWIDARTGAPNHLMSAAWTYNKVNGGGDGGSWMSTNMMISRDWGTATMATMPYNDRDPVGWGSMEAFREAPLHRATQVRGINYMGQTTVDAVKTLVSKGSPITFAFDASQYDPAFADGNFIMSSAEYNSFGLNHAQTIVGYDDAITDDGELGAFRVVNSWSAGWGDNGFYWLTYAAFKEFGSIGVLNLTYLDDEPSYVPTLLTVWHFNAAPTRSSVITVGIGPFSSPIQSKSPYFERETANKFPTFMALDISEFKADYDSGNRDLFLSMGSTATNGVMSSFRIEMYEGGFTPGAPTQVSGQSPSVPKSTPGVVAASLQYYVPIQPDQAVDMAGWIFTSSSYVRWTGVNHHYDRGGSAMQSGDVADAKSTDVQTVLTGPKDVWFDWKVSSETGADFLSFSIDNVKQAAISGDMDWRQMHYSIAPGIHTLKWEYTKDDVKSEKEDGGWIDNIVVDNAPPVTSAFLSGTVGGDGWYLSSVTVVLTALDENGSGVDRTYYRIDGGAWQVYTSAFVVPVEGIHSIEYYSTDNVGNVESAKTVNAKIDTVCPETAMSVSGTLGTGLWYVSPVTVTVSATDESSGVNWTRYRVDGGGWQYVGNFLLADDGQHLLEYQSEDLAGNNEAVKTLGVKIDQVGPSTGMSLTGTLGTNDWYTSNVDITLSGFDNTSGIDWTAYRVDAGVWQVYSGFFMITSDGVHSLEYYSQDLSGNREATFGVEVKIDQVPPVLILNQADGTIFTTTSVTMTWSSLDATSGVDRVETSLDGGAFVVHGPLTVSTVMSALSEGSHQLTVRSVDKAGLVTEKSVDFIVDSLPPVTISAVTGTSGLGSWYVSTAMVTLTAIDATTGLKSTNYRVDGGSWQLYTGQFPVTGDGRHVVEFYSTDNAGNVETTGSIPVEVDTADPATAATLEAMAGQNNWYVTSTKVSLSAFDGMSGVGWTKYRIDGGSWIEYRAPFTISVDGSHSVEFFSQDVAGHQEAVSSVSFKIDCAAPMLEIVSPAGDVKQSNVNVSWDGRDLVSGLDHYEIGIDGTAFQPMGKATSFDVELSNGDHVVIMRAVDVAGNVRELQLAFNVSSRTGGSQTASTPSSGLPVYIYALLAVLAATILLLVYAAATRRKRPDERRQVLSAAQAQPKRKLPPPPSAETSMKLPPPPTD